MTEAQPIRSSDRVGYLIKRAQAGLAVALTKGLRQHGVTLPQFAVLVALDEEPGLSSADLARRAFVTAPTMNQVVRELEERCWVARVAHPVHGRIRQSHLTAEGAGVLTACRATEQAVEDRLLGYLGPAERQQLAGALRKCIEALSARAGDPASRL